MRPLFAFCLLLTLVAGCRSSPAGSGWAYLGPDAALRYPPFSKERAREVDEDRGGARSGPLSEPMQRKLQDDLDAWQRTRAVAFERAREACRRGAGDRPAPQGQTERSDDFAACMKAEGWYRGSDPL